MEKWYMRLTIVNEDGGQTAMAMYPDSLYAILETLDECQIPYGGGRYRHLAVSPNGIPADELQRALASVIENEENPPSIRELNYLGEQIQQMTDQERNRLTEELLAIPQAAIPDAYGAIQHISGRKMEYGSTDLKERSVQLGLEDPYIRIQLIHDEDDPGDEKAGIWVDCPATEERIAKAARVAGVESLEELQPNMMDGVFAYSALPLIEQDGPFQSFHELNCLAIAMKEHGVLQDIGKFKAVLYFEDCIDFEEAAELAGKLNEYHFFRKAELECSFQKAGYSSIEDDILDKLEIEETPYGFIRSADGLSIDILMNQWLCGYREGGSGKPCYGVQGAEIAENKRRFAADLASASQQLYRLENEIQGQSGTFSQWLRIAHELNEDFERPYAEVVNEICDAVRYVDHQYGQEIAQQLYNSNRIILASEIREAAQYLSLGGRFENLAELARVGFLWEKPARMKCAVRLLL